MRSPSLARHAKRRALLVEDSANERELLAGYLRMCGYEVDLAEDGIAAMRYLSQHAPPDFVLLDMQLPFMDGRETLQAIRRNPALGGLKVFVVSGSDPQTVDLGEGNQGIEHWFAKPINPAEFVSELNRETAGEALGLDHGANRGKDAVPPPQGYQLMAVADPCARS